MADEEKPRYRRKCFLSAFFFFYLPATFLHISYFRIVKQKHRLEEDKPFPIQALVFTSLQ